LLKANLTPSINFYLKNNVFTKVKSFGSSVDTDDQIAQKFGERVGWKRRNSWLNYGDLIFDLNAPSGHLPLIRVQYGGKNILFSRKILPLVVDKLAQCEE
jgi:hypothetical protein